MAGEKSRFTSDRRVPSESSWAGESDWAVGVAEDVDAVGGRLVGRSPKQHSESLDSTIYDFEDGEWSGDWTDESQSASSIKVSDSRAYDGAYSLVVSSNPGTSTACRARSISSWSGANEYRLYLNKYADGGGHNSHRFHLLNRSNTSQQLYIATSSYSTPYVALQERDATGSVINTWVLKNSTDTPRGSWFEMSIDVRGPDTVIGTVDGASVGVTPDTDWTGIDVQMEISANGWGGGDKMYTAADNVEVKPSE